MPSCNTYRYLGFSYLGRGVSLHGCSSKAQPLLLTLDEGYLLTAALPDLERGIAPLGPPQPVWDGDSIEVHWRKKWQPTPVFLPGESQGRRSQVGCCLWGRTEWGTTEARGGGWEDQPHTVAARAQEGLEELSHVEGQ